MKVTVSKYLNVRVGAPRVSAPNYQYLAPGSVVDIDGKLYEGDNYDGNVLWYKDLVGNYYWSGGIEFDLFDNENFDRDPYANYNGNGKLIGLALFDSGVNNQHKYLTNRIKYYENFITNEDKQVSFSHGHKVAGIISSDDIKVNRNRSDLYCFKVINKANRVDEDAIIRGLKELNNIEQLHTNIDIINMSLNVNSAYIPHMQKLIDGLLVKGIVVVIAAGENFEFNKIAQLKRVIKVGTFNHEKLLNIISHGVPKVYDAFCLNNPIPCYPLHSNSLTASLSRDSAYTAFISAILARHFGNNSFPKDNNRLVEAKKYLNKIKIPIKNKVEPYKIYK